MLSFLCFHLVKLPESAMRVSVEIGVPPLVPVRVAIRNKGTKQPSVIWHLLFSLLLLLWGSSSLWSWFSSGSRSSNSTTRFYYFSHMKVGTIFLQHVSSIVEIVELLGGVFSCYSKNYLLSSYKYSYIIVLLLNRKERYQGGRSGN